MIWMSTKAEIELLLGKVITLHKLGRTNTEISREIGKSPKAVYNYLHKLGLQPNRRQGYVETIPECDTCSQPDCIWNGESKYCPEQRKEQKKRGRPRKCEN